MDHASHIFTGLAGVDMQLYRIIPKLLEVALLTSVTRPVFAFLQQNDSYRLPGQLNSPWVPTVPIRMIHDVNDDLVPYANSQVAFNAFSTAGVALQAPSQVNGFGRQVE